MWFQVVGNDDHRSVEENRQTIHQLSQFVQVRRGQMGTVELDGNTVQTRITTWNLRFQVSREAAHLHLATSNGTSGHLPDVRERSCEQTTEVFTSNFPAAPSWAYGLFFSVWAPPRPDTLP